MSESEGAMQKAQRQMRAERPKRFYKSAEAVRDGEGFSVVLDGRAVRTPARNVLAVPSEQLALTLAEEWNAQGAEIDPASMPLTRLVNSALDGVARDPDAVRGEILKYAGSDLVCYRAEGPERLLARQKASWDPVLNWLAERFLARFVPTQGVMFVEQPKSAVAALEPRLQQLGVLQLAAVSAITTLTGSALLALAVLEGRLSEEDAWLAAHVDEDWNIELWGEDSEAAARRAGRYAEMQAAARLIALTA